MKQYPNLLVSNRNELINNVLNCAIVYLCFALPFSLLIYINTSNQKLLIIHGVTSIVLAVVYLQKKKLSKNTKGLIFIALLFCIGMFNILQYAPSAVGYFYFLASSMLARAITGTKQAIFISVAAVCVTPAYLLVAQLSDFSFYGTLSNTQLNVTEWIYSMSIYLYINMSILYLIHKSILLQNRELPSQTTKIDKQHSELTLSNSMLTDIINTLPFSITWKDANLLMKGANKHFLEEHGLKQLELGQLKSDIGLFGIAEAKKRFEIESLIINKQYQSHTFQGQYENAEGQTIYKKVQHFGILNAEESITGLVVVETDITKLVELEKRSDLDMNGERKLQLIKSTFLANVSHEIRTPLSGIKGMIQLLKTGSHPSEQAKYYEHINASVFMLDQLLSDLVDLSKIEAGELRIERSPFEINERLERLISVFRTEATKKRLKFIVTIDDQANKKVVGDAKRLIQILNHLLSNAIKFTHSGEVRLAISLKLKYQAILATFTVSDTGIGFDNDKVNYLFNTFTQNENNKTRRFGGNGLGLPIVKNLLDMMNGKISATSEPNKGSNFTVNIPFTISKRKSDQTIETTETLESRKLSILLVEDNEINQEIAKGMLVQESFDVVVVGNGKLALDYLTDNTCDIILMDIQMPVMDGITATINIRKSYNINDLPIIAVTANVMTSDIQHYMKVGFNTYVAKPYDKKTLLNTIKEVVAKNIDRRLANYF